jgi:hypothetical protein
MMIWRLIKGWLIGDRIRISPQTGELFRFQVGQRVIMNDALWVIAKRQVRCSAETPGDQTIGVSYHLVQYGAGKHPGPSAEPPFMGDDADWVAGERDENSVWMDCYL